MLPILAAALCGVFNGFLVTRLAVQPIVATLVLFIAGRGIAQVVTDGSLQAFNNPAFQWIALGKVAGVPFQILLMFALVALFAWIVSKTLFGKYLLDHGRQRKGRVPVRHPDRARQDDRVHRMRRARRAGGADLDLGEFVVGCERDRARLELDAIAAVAVGGTALTGGKAYIAGTLIGALIIQLLRYTLLAHGIPDAAALVVKAGIIIAAVYVQRRSALTARKDSGSSMKKNLPILHRARGAARARRHALRALRLGVQHHVVLALQLDVRADLGGHGVRDHHGRHRSFGGRGGGARQRRGGARERYGGGSRRCWPDRARGLRSAC